jgi:16S rRNA (guanine527-N7)-methyltransferase
MRALERSRALGLLGPGPVSDHVAHAVAMADAVGGSPHRFLDLGSGGGVPGLVLAELWPDAEAVLLDAGVRRAEVLREAVSMAGLGGRVTVAEGRAEVLGRDPELRQTFDLVVARSFAPPPVTAECASPFLSVQGRLVVSEPPEGSAGRWPPDSLAQLALADAGLHSRAGRHFRVLVRVGELSDRYPRRTGVPDKRPLWHL